MQFKVVWRLQLINNYTQQENHFQIEWVQGWHLSMVLQNCRHQSYLPQWTKTKTSDFLLQDFLKRENRLNPDIQQFKQLNLVNSRSRRRCHREHIRRQLLSYNKLPSSRVNLEPKKMIMNFKWITHIQLGLWIIILRMINLENGST